MLAVLGPDTNPMLTLAMGQCEEGKSGTMASIEERWEKAQLWGYKKFYLEALQRISNNILPQAHVWNKE